MTDAGFGTPPPGFRLPSAARPGRVKLQVTRLDRSADFYTAVIGFEVAAQRPGALVLRAGRGDGPPLIELHERPGGRPVAPGSRLGLYHFAILVPDRGALGRFLVHAVRAGLRLGSADHLVSEALYLSDPDGLGIEVYADRPRSTWRTEAGELMMATDPLDLGGLAASAEGEWSGMPAETAIGHVHLHVGDLGAAEAFYHRALGFDRTVSRYPGALFLSASGYHHHLGTNVWAKRAVPRAEDEAGLLEWELVLPTAAAITDAAASLRSGGYEVAPADGSVLVHDDWGTGLRLVTA